jgi:hypothetical protein
MNQDILIELFDYRDGDLWWRVRPKQSRVNIDKPAGRVNAFGYRRIQAKGRDYPAHWLVWLYFKGKWPNGEVDHINADNLHGEFSRAS